MALSSGTLLGPYEIQSPLGAGVFSYDVTADGVNTKLDTSSSAPFALGYP